LVNKWGVQEKNKEKLEVISPAAPPEEGKKNESTKQARKHIQFPGTLNCQDFHQGRENDYLRRTTCLLDRKESWNRGGFVLMRTKEVLMPAQFVWGVQNMETWDKKKKPWPNSKKEQRRRSRGLNRYHHESNSGERKAKECLNLGALGLDKNA